MGKLAAAEAELRAKSAGNPAIGDPWADIARATAAYRELYLPYRFIQPQGDLYGYATTLVRAAAERAKPNSERLPGYSDSALPLRRKAGARRQADRALARPARARMEPEQGARISRRRRSRHQAAPRQGIARGPGETAGHDDPARRSGRTARRCGTAARRRSTASKDPMIVYARRLDAALPPAAGRARRALSGPGDRRPGQARRCPLRRLWRHASIPTRRSRCASATARSWAGPSAARRCRPLPMLGGTYDRATGADPFDLPSAFVTARSRIDPKIVYDFVTTNDIIGGNSGSPVIDRSGRGDRRRVRRQHPQPRRQLRLRRVAATGRSSFRPTRSRKRWRKSTPRRALVAELKRS